MSSRALLSTCMLRKPSVYLAWPLGTWNNAPQAGSIILPACTATQEGLGEKDMTEQVVRPGGAGARTVLRSVHVPIEGVSFSANHVYPKGNSLDSQAFLVLHDAYLCTGPSPRRLAKPSAPRSPCRGGPDLNDGQRGVCEARRMYCLYLGDCTSYEPTPHRDTGLAPRPQTQSMLDLHPSTAHPCQGSTHIALGSGRCGDSARRQTSRLSRTPRI